MSAEDGVIYLQNGREHVTAIEVIESIRGMNRK
jgi:hypothetical protein